mgnify:CR=1 FL=1
MPISFGQQFFHRTMILEDSISPLLFFGNRQLPFHALSSKPITASEKEIEENSRSRSAVLRIAERVKPLKRELA